MDGLDASMRELAAALSGIGEKVDRLAELTLAVERMSSSTAAAVEVLSRIRYFVLWFELYVFLTKVHFCILCMVFFLLYFKFCSM